VIVVFIVLIALVVFAIAVVTVGAVVNRLAAAPPTSVFDLDEAVHFVADRLPDDLTAELSYDDVRKLLQWHLDYLEEKGVATEADVGALPSGPIIAGEDEGVAFVLGRATDDGLEIDDVAVVEVLEAETAYLTAIGAIGGEVSPPADPLP